MIRILANDGIDNSGKALLEAAGFFVETNKVPQDKLSEALQDFDAVLVRSATKIRKELLASCPHLKLIGRGGVGLDNIDVDFAKLKGIKLEKANFSFVCHDLSNLSDYVKQIDTATFKILKRALPGPYTFILPGNNDLPKEFRKKKTVGIRVPDNNIALEIVRMLGNPIVSTSIHDEDEVLEYSTDPELIFEKWQNKVDLVIDGGYGDNVGSTIIDLSGYEPIVVREGKGNINIF
jgi:tRNA threonylcarbamoyl adenosine modification protein (Sua5/YciO/YrdC/YwlC family)